MPEGVKLKSIEDASVIRKFTVLFSFMSLLPFVILFVLFTTKDSIKISDDLFFWAIVLIGIFSFIGFMGMRNTLMNLVSVSQNAKGILEGDLSKRIRIKTTGDNEVTQLAKTFNEVVRKLESNIKQLEKSRKMVQEVLLQFASGASSTENIDSFLDLTLQVTVNAVDGAKGLLLITDQAKNELVVKSAFNLGPAYGRGKRIPLGDEMVGWVIKQKRPLLIPRLDKTFVDADQASAFNPPLICAPLIFHSEAIGAISISEKKEGNNFEEDELVVLSNIASQIALSMENYRLNSDNQKAYLETITALALAVEARDIYSRGHSDRVGDYSVKIAQTLGLNQEEIKAIKEAAQLHDVGKIGISDEILRKPDMLDDYERNIMEQHVLIGEGIIIPLHGFSHLRDPIRHHHEWLNGEGYPDHFKGDQIGLGARILAVADSFDAMTTDRPYRKGMSFGQAKQELIKYKDIRYDSKVVDAFIGCINL